MLACPIDEVHIEKGAEYLKRYKWNTEIATHHFCHFGGEQPLSNGALLMEILLLEYQ